MTEIDDRHEVIEELSGAAALRALSPEEARLVSSHLEGCARCREQYAELAATAELLLRVPEPVEPSPGLRDRILALAAQTPQDLPDEGASAAPSAPPPLPFQPRRPQRRFDWRSLGLVASLAATLFFGYSTLRLQGELAAQTDRVSRAEAVIQAATTGRVVQVRGTGERPEVRGTAMEARGRAQLYLEGLPPPPEGQLYQVWLVPPGGQPIGAGLATGGGDPQTIPLQRPLEGMALVAVTLEPAPGGSPRPTSPILAAGRL